MSKRLAAILLFVHLACAGCAEKRPATATADMNGGKAEGPAKAEALLSRDPAGPVPSPKLPQHLAASAKTAQSASQAGPAASRKGQGIRYSVNCVSPEVPELAEAFAKSSLLQRLIDTPPSNLIGLEQRLSASLGEGRNILHSQGYYAGTVEGKIETSEEPEAPSDPEKDSGGKTVVHVFFTPGPRYVMGRSKITVAGRKEDAPFISPDERNAKESPAGKPAALPVSLADVGLPQGSPAGADAILEAVDRARAAFRNQGYPFAKIDATRYVVDHETRTLEADVRIDAGEFVRMGDIRVEGEAPVSQHYLEALRTWEPGAPWNQDAVDAFHDNLRQSGLFRSITLSPANLTDLQGRRDVMTSLAPTPPRTLSGSLKYDSDFGPGIQGGWEHRNFTGRGDNLRLAMNLWMDMQEVTAKYRLPYFLRKDQAFIAQAGILHEDTDAYDMQSAAASAGIERRFSPHWSGSVQGSAEGGSIKEPHDPRRDYIMFGIPVSVAFDNTGSLLDATRGARLLASVTPYTGTYGDNFSVLRTRLDAQAFLPAVGADTLVFALRGAYGSLWGATAPDVPPSVRFYSGGGGSVRGYEYQSLGPRDNGNKPLGGSSLLELSGEARWKITPEWGLVAFLDGGMAYEDAISNFASDLRWGGGLGLRYYTAIGPVRFDVAAPLTPRSDDAPLQFYISIGQSF